MLTTTTKHALRALVVLATQDEKTSVLGRDLAAMAKIPPNYLSKILLDLGRAGLVSATRGTGGGYRLAVPPGKIGLIDVVGVFEGVRTRPQCLLGCEHSCSDDNPCSAHAAWSAVKKAYLDFLEMTTLADIVAHAKDGKPCHPAADGEGGSVS
ncbi:MAG: Rrf2 family transcriptional regulator [Acidobacteria bacterium]|nr:Rrf2 family transcriptional regulator [Acidobacteriota bacterium]